MTKKKLERGERKAVIVSEQRERRYTKTSQFTARVAISASLSILEQCDGWQLTPKNYPAKLNYFCHVLIY